jgi:hypothetical protein
VPDPQSRRLAQKGLPFYNHCEDTMMMSKVKEKAQEQVTMTRLKLWISILVAGFTAGGAFAIDQSRDIIDSIKIEKLQEDVTVNEEKRQGDHDSILEIRTDVRWIRQALTKSESQK